MPVIHVRAIDRGGGKSHALVERLPGGVEAATGIPARETWVTFELIERRRMSVGGEPVTKPEGSVAFAEVHYRPRDGATEGALLEAVARCMASELDLPLEDVWVRGLPIVPGQVFAGGALLD